MLRRIILATDFSTRSDRLLLRSKLIARETGAEIVLVHVVDDQQPERLLAPAMMEARALLRETANTLREEDGLTATFTVKASDISAGVLAAADEAEADLIMLGSPRNRAFGTCPGRTVERVLRGAAKPILIALAPPTAPYGRSLLAMDFDDASQAAARAALALGIFDRLQVTIMHAVDPVAEGHLRRSMVGEDAIASYRTDQRESASLQLKEEVEGLGLPSASTRAVTMIGSPARTILEAAKAEGAELVIMGTSQRKGLARILIGSVAADMIRDSERDLLIVPVD